MAVTLAGIVLPADIQWVNEFAGFGVGQSISPTLTGSLLIEETEQTDGRPITLESGDGSWTERQVVEQLATLESTPLEDGETLVLDWSDGRLFDVVFDRSSGSAFRASEVYRLSASSQEATHPYFISISLLIKDTP